MLDGWNSSNRDNLPPTKPSTGRQVIPPRTDNINPHGVRAGRSDPPPRTTKGGGDIRRLDSLDSSTTNTPHSVAVVPPAVPGHTQPAAMPLSEGSWRRVDAYDEEEEEEGDDGSVDRELKGYMKNSQPPATNQGEPEALAPVEALETLDFQPQYEHVPKGLVDEEQEEFPNEEREELQNEEREEFQDEEREEPNSERMEVPGQSGRPAVSVMEPSIRPSSAAAPASQALIHLSNGNTDEVVFQAPVAEVAPQPPRQFGYRDESPPTAVRDQPAPLVPRDEDSNSFNPDDLQRAAQQRIREHRLAQEEEQRRRKEEEDAFRKRRVSEKDPTSIRGSSINMDDVSSSGGKLALLHYLRNGENGTKRCYYSITDEHGNKKRKRLSKQKRKMLLSILLLNTNIGAKDTNWKGNELVRALARSAEASSPGHPTSRGPSEFASQFGVVSQKESAGSSLRKRKEYTAISTKLPRTRHLICDGDDSDIDSPEDSGDVKQIVASPPKTRAPYHYCYCPGHPHEHFVNTKGQHVSPSPVRTGTAPAKQHQPQPTMSQVSNTKFPVISPRKIAGSKPPTAATQYRPAPPPTASNSLKVRSAPGTASSINQRSLVRLDKIQHSATEDRKYWSAKYMFERQQRLAEKRVYLRELTAMWAERFDRSPYWANQLDICVVETTKKKTAGNRVGEEEDIPMPQRTPLSIPRHPLDDDGTGEITFENAGQLKRMKLVRRKIAARQRLSPGMRRRSHNFTEAEMIQLLEDKDRDHGTDEAESTPNDIARRAILQSIQDQPDAVERRRVLAKELRQLHPRYFKVRKDFEVVVDGEYAAEELPDGGSLPACRELIIQTDEIRPGDSDWHFLYEGSSDDEEYSGDEADDTVNTNEVDYVVVELEADEELREGDEVLEFFNVKVGSSRPSTRENSLGGKRVSFDRKGERTYSSTVPLGTIHNGVFENGGATKGKKKKIKVPLAYKPKVQHRPDGSMVVKRDTYKVPTSKKGGGGPTENKAADDFNNAAKLLGGKVGSAHRYREDIVIRYEPKTTSGSRPTVVGGQMSSQGRLNYHSSAHSLEGVPMNAQDNNFLRAHYTKLYRLEDEVGREMEVLHESMSPKKAPQTPASSVSENQLSTPQSPHSPLPPRSPKPPQRHSHGLDLSAPLSHKSRPPPPPPLQAPPPQPPAPETGRRPISAPFVELSSSQRPYRTDSRSSPLSVEDELGLQVDPTRITAGELTRRISLSSSRPSSHRGRSPKSEARRKEEEAYRLAQEEHARTMAEVEAEIAALELEQQQSADYDSRRQSREERRQSASQRNSSNHNSVTAYDDNEEEL